MSEVCASSIEGAQGECAACGRAKLEDVCEEYATLRATFLDSPAQVRLEMGTYEGFIGKFRRPHFSNFGPPAAPTFSNFARGVDRRPFCGGARRCGVWGPRRTLAHRGPRRPTLAGFVPICTRCTLADLTPKYPTLATSSPG